MKTRLVLILGTLCAAVSMAEAVRSLRLDADGVMRWADDGTEAALFGVNYYAPFSIDYEWISRRGFDHEQAIRDDVTHFQRLGLTSIRLHCWDREISDREGNLIDNRHMELLDLLISECRERDIYTVLTPIAWWGAPNPGGFSDIFPMFDMTTKRETWPVQQRYLRQFVQHRNRYTGLRYMEDPAVIAFEVINEPLYPSGTPDATVTDYINALVTAVKDTGCTKPVFYNCWTGRHAAAAAAETLDGVTFGWYPTGLVSGATITTNELFKVDDYPSMRDPVLAGKARMVYEFDAADVQAPYMYPAVARAFRGGGAQIANQFQYDPVCLADTNRNWQTHYLNLMYTPGKAISFAIAAEAFRRLPRLENYGTYPVSCRFGEFRVDFEEGLSEWLGTESFMYSNDTSSLPPDPAALTRVWGCGSSPLVKYSGTGACFLDRIEPGLWSLQVYPDAVQVADPYSGGESRKTCLIWGKQRLEVLLPDLGPAPQIRPTGESPEAESLGDAVFRISPGEYLLGRTAAVTDGRTGIFPYVCPRPADPPGPAGCVEVEQRWREGHSLPVSASLALSSIDAVRLMVQPSGSSAFQAIPMRAVHPYRYAAEVPSALCTPGTLRLYVEAHTPSSSLAFPGALETVPENRELRRTFFQVTPDLVPLRSQASEDVPGGARVTVSTDPVSGEAALRLAAGGFGPAPSSAGVVLAANPVTDPDFVPTAVSACVRGGPDTTGVEIGFRLEDGSAFGTGIPVSPVWDDVTIPLKGLHPLWKTSPKTREMTTLKEISLIFGAWILPGTAKASHWVEIRSLSLIRSPETVNVRIAAADSPVTLLHLGEVKIHPRGGEASVQKVPGMQRGERAVRVTAGPFGPPPACRSFRLHLPPTCRTWLHDRQPSAIVLTARAVEPYTSCIEVVMLEEDGSPWGTEIPLTGEWQEIRIPLNDFRFFSHWPHPDIGGGEGDSLDPARLTAVNVCFGAWLYPEHTENRHGFEIQSIAIAE